VENFIQHLINGVSLGSIYALIALGYTMVYGILQLINFAHSEVYMIGAFVAYFLVKYMAHLGIVIEPGMGLFILLLLASMIGCSLVGLIIERFAYRPLRRAPKLNTLITAIGVSLFLQYAGQVVFGADPKNFPTILEDHALLKFGEIELQLFDVTILTVAVLFMAALHYMIHHTKVGKAMRAVSTNAMAASLMGIDTDKIIARTFIIGSSLAGVGSILVGMKYPKIDPLMGMNIGLKAFVAAVLGGIGNLGGAVLGGVIMGLSEELVVGYLSSTYRDALAFSILIMILFFRPAGLLGKWQTEKV
jgi:branched-chain amino acid transport system permease protein